MKHLAPLLALFALVFTTRAQTVKHDIPYTDEKDDKRTLDIYSPTNAKNLPVVFWIHGGGWQSGDKSDVKLKPQWFMDKGFVFVSDHIAEYGGDPKRILVGGHSAGAQLAAILCTDERYLKEQGISFDVLKACVPVDGDTYDVPA